MLHFDQELWTPRTLSRHTAGILDLDGTLADNRQRDHLLPAHGLPAAEANLAWDRYFLGMHRDRFVQHIADMYNYLCGRYPTMRRVIISGRPARFRQSIVEWLVRYNFDIDELYLRGNDDFSPNAEFKQRIAQRLRQEGLTPVFALDDDINSCRAYQTETIYSYVVELPNRITPLAEWEQLNTVSP